MQNTRESLFTRHVKGTLRLSGARVLAVHTYIELVYYYSDDLEGLSKCYSIFNLDPAGHGGREREGEVPSAHGSDWLVLL